MKKGRILRPFELSSVWWFLQVFGNDLPDFRSEFPGIGILHRQDGRGNPYLYRCRPQEPTLLFQQLVCSIQGNGYDGNTGLEGKFKRAGFKLAQATALTAGTLREDYKGEAFL